MFKDVNGGSIFEWVVQSLSAPIVHQHNTSGNKRKARDRHVTILQIFFSFVF